MAVAAVADTATTLSSSTFFSYFKLQLLQLNASIVDISTHSNIFILQENKFSSFILLLLWFYFLVVYLILFPIVQCAHDTTDWLHVSKSERGRNVGFLCAHLFEMECRSWSWIHISKFETYLPSVAHIQWMRLEEWIRFRWDLDPSLLLLQMLVIATAFRCHGSDFVRFRSLRHSFCVSFQVYQVFCFFRSL